MVDLAERDQLVVGRLAGEGGHLEEVQVPGLVQPHLLLPEVLQDDLVGARQARDRHGRQWPERGGAVAADDGPGRRKAVGAIRAHRRRPPLVALGGQSGARRLRLRLRLRLLLRRRRRPPQAVRVCPGLCEGARWGIRHTAGIGRTREAAHDGRHDTKKDGVVKSECG